MNLIYKELVKLEQPELKLIWFCCKKS